MKKRNMLLTARCALVPSLALLVGGINPCFAWEKEESLGKK
jgi:hypothetical protein